MDRQEASVSGDGTVGEVVTASAEFEGTEGRRPRILVAVVEGGGDDQRAVASAFADLGFDVDVSPVPSTPEGIARQAVDNDVHVVALLLASTDRTVESDVRKALAELGGPEVMIVVVAGTGIAVLALDLLTNLRARLDAS